MELVQPDYRVNILAGAMRLKKARLADTGMYVCGVANSAAEDYTVITLQVTGKSLAALACTCTMWVSVF